MNQGLFSNLSRVVEWSSIALYGCNTHLGKKDPCCQSIQGGSWPVPENSSGVFKPWCWQHFFSILQVQIDHSHNIAFEIAFFLQIDSYNSFWFCAVPCSSLNKEIKMSPLRVPERKPTNNAKLFLKIYFPNKINKHKPAAAVAVKNKHFFKMVI